MGTAVQPSTNKRGRIEASDEFERYARAERMISQKAGESLAAILAAALSSLLLLTGSVHAATAKAGSEQLKRGEYLAGFGGCHDCHSPKLMTPKGPIPDKARLLSGHPASMAPPPIPAGALAPGQWLALTNGDLTAWAGPWGISYDANLTPDKTTGLGAWTSEQFIRTMRTGKHLGVGRGILPPMPWESIGALTDRDLKALFAYLQSLPPIQNAVPQPVPPMGP